jgi:hypothetical protein
MMQDACFLYHSTLAPAYDAHCVADIIRRAREVNATLGITGVLVFDGERFAQYLEGPAQPLDELVAQIAGDLRHTAFTPLWRGPLAGARRYAAWSMAYASMDDADPLTGLQQLQGEPAVAYFHALARELDGL